MTCEFGVPLDPYDLGDPGPTEFCHGAGLFPPGIANNEGQRRAQDDFGIVVDAPRSGHTTEDNFARMVADKRTDPTDPHSVRNFEDAGNPDRYGPKPPLVLEEPMPRKPHNVYPYYPRPVERGW